MSFYSVLVDGSAETDASVTEVLDYIYRFIGEGEAAFRVFATKTPTELFVKLYSFVDQINARPIKRIVSSEFVRTQLRYASPDTEKKDKDSLHQWRKLTYEKIRFVLSHDLGVANIPPNKDVYFLLNKRKSDEELLALCRITYVTRPVVVHVDTVASLVKGACTKMTLALAEKLISTGTRIVYLQSINNAAHGCYVKNYLKKFKYAFMWVDDSEKISLIDLASTEIWLDYHSTGGNINNIQIDTSVYMMYVLDDASLRATVADGLFLRYSGRSRARMIVYCKKSEGVSEAMDEFMSPRYGNDRRALFIDNLNEYNGKVPKRQKMVDDDE